MPDFPDRGVAIANELLRLHPGMTLGGREDEGRAFVRLVAEQLAFELGPAYGVKSAGPGRPQGPSQIAYRPATYGRFGGWRIIDNDGRATGTAGAILPLPTWQDFPDQVFIPVDPIDHLQVSATRPPDRPPDPPAPPVDLAPLLARLDALDTAVMALSAQLPIVAREAHEGANRPLPRYVATVFGIKLISVPEGS